ncbi:FadR/GntR family transcriptional regulator [Pseudactinotalea terrae]|uniref:FadR/GntR family transcriptional regulator n=1 Tax=Pseudactinotalea terrae TaxID=1743262 RepID=UPI0012E2931E|nr:FadR/GntR family transcriptional regulator [Pseudactinotalea terrae]
MPATPTHPERTPPRTASDAVVAHLEDLIFDRTYEAGDSLPSEAELSAQLQVSRLTVREGVRSLAARGLVEVSHGRRPVVVATNASQLRDFFSSSVRRDAGGLLELLEVRLAIEVHAAELAARNATQPQIESLEAALQAMTDAADDDSFTAADMRFHHGITEASGNRMISLLVEGMADPLKVGRLKSLHGYLQGSPDLGDLLEEHRLILAKIAARDAPGAARAMRKHLATTRRDLLRAFSG